MKKEIIDIIAFACSPSVHRNSDAMLDAFIEGVKEYAGDQCSIKKIYLKDVPIDMYCYENSKGVEAHEQLFKALTDDMRHARGLIIATPTYNFSIPAHLKNFIDRLKFIALDSDHKNILGQPVGRLKYLSIYSLVSGGSPVWLQKLLFFLFPPFWLRVVFSYYGAHYRGSYYSGDIRTFENTKKLEVCRRRGRRYIKKEIRKNEK